MKTRFWPFSTPCERSECFLDKFQDPGRGPARLLSPLWLPWFISSVLVEVRITSSARPVVMQCISPQRYSDSLWELFGFMSCGSQGWVPSSQSAPRRRGARARYPLNNFEAYSTFGLDQRSPHMAGFIVRLGVNATTQWHVGDSKGDVACVRKCNGLHA